MSVLRVFGLMIVSVWLAAGCNGAKKIDVGGTCILNSDCGGSLVCTLGICHVACHASADCPTGQSCIAASDQSMVCQKPTTCTYNSDCQAGLMCAVDQQCRKQCQTDVDCSYGQTCTTTQTCAELNQVDSNKNLLVPDGSASGTGGVSGAGGSGDSTDVPGSTGGVTNAGGTGGATSSGGAGDAGVPDAHGAQPDGSIGGSGGGAGGIGGGGSADAGVADAIVADAPVGTGGTVGTDGNIDAGSADGSEEASTGNPPGYYMTNDWNVTSVDWHGCAWTAFDALTGSTTSIKPPDFTTATTEGGPYHVTGTVFNDYNSVALLGFNLNESVTGSRTQCAYDLAKSQIAGPPAVTMPGWATGIAFNWSRGNGFTLRIQIQSSDGYNNANHRWCATITDPAGGPSFVRFSDFYTQCWYLGTSTSPGTQYAGDPIDAVIFLVPGRQPQTTPFDFAINGFAPGTSAADAP